MPDRGLLEPAAVEPVELGEQPAALTLTDARWLQITFEVAQQPALAAMPCEVSRPVPCYARLLIATGDHNAERLSLAALMVGGRYRMMPRNVLVQAVVDGDEAAVRGVLGSGVVAGTISLTREGQASGASVSVGGQPTAEVRLPSLYAIEPTMLRWDAWLGFARHSGETVITEMLVAPEVGDAFLSKGGVVEMDSGLPRTHPWRQLRSLLTVSSCYAEGTFVIGPTTVQQSWT